MFWQSVKKTWGGLLEERVEKSRDSPLAYLGCLKSHEISWDPFFHSPMKATRFWFRCPFVDLSWSFSSDLAKMRPFPGLTIQKVSVSGTRAAKSVAGQEIYIVPQPFIECLLIVTYDIDEAKSKQNRSNPIVWVLWVQQIDPIWEFRCGILPGTRTQFTTQTWHHGCIRYGSPCTLVRYVSLFSCI